MHCKFLLVFFLIPLFQEKIVSIVAPALVPSNATDLQSLLAFKAAIEFDPNNVLANNWTTGTNFCDWYGVSCSKRGQRVTRLELVSMGLVGTISPHVGNLSFLTTFNLANNSFHGPVIEELGHLSRLRVLVLASNNLRGEIPMSIPLCRKLNTIVISLNGLTGTLPANLTTLPNLRHLILGANNLTGTIPRSLGNMSTLQALALETNQFRGTILYELALLPRLELLSLSKNYLSGTIPPSLFNITSLVNLSLALNNFTGDLPKDTSLELPNLSHLFLNFNQLTGSIPSYWYNATRLVQLVISGNYFTGTLPTALPLSLQLFIANNCTFQHEIPKGIGNLRNLTALILFGNRLSGTIPRTIKQMKSLQKLYLSYNELEGPIPDEFCLLRNLGDLYLSMNRLSGSIPECIGNLSSLQQLALDNNRLSSRIPQSLWSLNQLLFLELSSNLLHGDLSSNFTTIKHLDILDLSRNKLSGDIPDFLGSLQTLTHLDMSWNSFSGPIPESFKNMILLVSMNISNNNLSGQIPKSLEALTDLKYLNLSYNNLRGPIPIRGPFVNFTLQSFIGNRALCGDSIFKSCPNQGLKKSRKIRFSLSDIVQVVVVVLVVVVLFYVAWKRRRNKMTQNPEISVQDQRRISYHELSHATIGFSDANFIGSGGFSRVYKGILSDGKIVAVKLLNLTIDGAIKSFDAECQVLRTVRHRNLVKVISTCTNHELRALVLEYIPNGSLEKWLYSHNYCLTFLQRVSIMLDVAVAMEYLHCGLTEPVIHCDLKPNNVLLDDDMVAHVGDFGIAKILASNKTETQTSTLGTLGYMSPEYGGEGKVSTKGDVYSYGIMLLETFTRKKPTDGIFSEELNLRQWVSSLVPNGIAKVIDENLLNANAQEISEMSLNRCFLAVMDLGLGCSGDSPDERFEMKDVVTKLNKIKSQILLK